MLRGRKGTIAWNLVASPWTRNAAAVVLSLSLSQALRAQSSTSITGQTLVNGSATWENLGGGNWLFKVGSQSAIINFTSFGIPEGAEVEFIMSPNARVLNRVLGDFPTEINGRLLSSGQVFIVNPAGVFIGPNGVVNVGTLYAAAADLEDEDFGLDGEPVPTSYKFGKVRGEVRNEGLIEVQNGATLIGTRVVNLGVGPDRGIVVNGAGGIAMMIAHDGDVTVFEPSANPQLFALVGGGSNLGGVGVENAGRVSVAAGGQIRLGAGDIYSVAIRNTGELSAQDGQIHMSGPTIEQSGNGITAGQLTIDGVGGTQTALTVGGSIDADSVDINASTVTLSGATTFQGQGGAGDQATNVAIIGDVVSGGGAPQSLVLDSANASVDGNLGGAGNARLASLTSTGNVSVTGNVSSTGDVFVQNTLALNGTVAQSVAAEGTIDVGSLTSTEDATVEGKSVLVRGDASSDKSLSITATLGGADINGNASAASGLSVSGESVNVAGNASTTAGALNVTSTNGSATVGGSASAGGNVTIGATGGNASVGAVTSGGAASVTATGGVTAASVSAATGATVSGASVNVAGNASTTAGALNVTSTNGSATVGGSASAGGNVTIGATGGNAILGGDVTAASGNVDIFGDGIRLGGDITGGSGSGNSITLTGPIVLDADSRWSAFDVVVNGTIDGAAAGAQTLRLASGNRSLLAGDVGSANRLGGFVIEDGFTLLGTTAGGSFVVNADLFSLEPASRPSDMGVDLASLGALTINTDAFTMAQGTKATVLGDFTINNGSGVARLSDVNTIGVFEVNAGQIVLLTRGGASALTSVGAVEDTGLDFVSLGGFRFSVVPVLEGAGSVRFASPDATGDLNGNLIDFVMLNLNDSSLGLSGIDGGVIAGDFSSGLSFFDLVADGTTSTSNATALAALVDPSAGEAEDPSVALSTAERRRLQSLLGGLDVRMPSDREMLDIRAQAVLFEDQSRSEASEVSRTNAGQPRPLSAAAQRFSGARVRELLAASAALETVPASARRTALDAMMQAHADGKPLADAVRASGSADARAAMAAVGRFIQLGVQLGMTDTERQRAGRSGAPFPQAQVDVEKPFLVPAAAFDGAFWSAISESPSNG